MRKIIVILLTLFNLYFLGVGQQEDDVIDISKITVFPQDYKPKLRAGYLSITQNTQSLYYILC